MHFKEHTSRLCKPYLFFLSVLKVVVPHVVSLKQQRERRETWRKKMYVLVVSEALSGGGVSESFFFPSYY